jgi:hypothetical protein
VVVVVVVVAIGEKVEAASAGWCVDCAVEADAGDDWWRSGKVPVEMTGSQSTAHAAMAC